MHETIFVLHCLISIQATTWNSDTYVYIKYFFILIFQNKTWIMLGQIVKVWNIKCCKDIGISKLYFWSLHISFAWLSWRTSCGNNILNLSRIVLKDLNWNSILAAKLFIGTNFILSNSIMTYCSWFSKFARGGWCSVHVISWSSFSWYLICLVVHVVHGGHTLQFYPRVVFHKIPPANS